jgi:ATP-dependent RNA helicase DDX46/PRP5
MIATSVAARGLDVKNLVLVVNYEAPNHIEDYVHRVGRTGRAGRKGTAITFLTPDEERYAPGLSKALSQAGKAVPAKLQEMATEYERKRAAGEAVQKVQSGYKTKGFQFTDEERRAQRSKEMAMYGLGEMDENKEGEEEDEEGPLKTNQPKSQADLMKMLEQIEDPSIRKLDASGADVSQEALRIAGLLPAAAPGAVRPNMSVAEIAR